MSAHPVDSAVYGHLWSTPELHALLDDRGRVQGWLEILAALAEAQADLGLIPADAAVAIRAAARAELIDLDRLAAETRASNHVRWVGPCQSSARKYPRKRNAKGSAV